MGPWVDYPAVHEALSAVEIYADTGKTKAALRRARQAVRALRNELYQLHPRESWSDLALFAVQAAASENAVFATIEDARRALASAEDIPVEEAGRRLFHPYRDITAKPATLLSFPALWHTDTTVLLAQQMYESREFSAMPILADALQDAGCDNEDVLNHCRDPNQVHVRGCWVVDLVLGKQ